MTKLETLTDEELSLLIKKNSRGKSTMILELLSYEILRRCIFDKFEPESNLPAKIEDK